MKEINFAQVLSAKRRERGITQDELASFAGVSKASVSKWETGQSYPDITLLPVIASYFDMSIDSLIGYAPQLSKEKIMEIYSRLAKSFAESPFEEVISECEALIKKYYTCYPFIVQICQLYVNHIMITDNKERAKELYISTADLCGEVISKSNDAQLVGEATGLQACCYLCVGDANRVIEILGESIKPTMTYGALLSQAYQILGNTRKAEEIIQAELYQNVMGTFNGLMSYIQANIGNYDVAMGAFRRAESLGEIFQMKQLNANCMAVLYALGGTMCITADKQDEAIKMLEKYVDICIHGFFPFEPRADEFFDKLDSWIEENRGSMPRAESTVKESMLNDVLLSPSFNSLHDNDNFTKLIGKMRDFIGGE